MESKNKFLIVGILIITIILVLIIFGFGSFFKFIKWFLIVLMIVLFIGFIFYVVYNIFFKPRKVDIVALQSKKIISSAKICKPSHLRNLYLSGDRIHESVKLGRITGFTIVENYNSEREYIYTFKKFGFPLDFFEDDKIVRVNPEDSTRPIGDVYLRSLALIKQSEYYYLNTDMLNVRKIDETIYQEAKRGLLFLTLAEMKQIVDKAIGIDAYHQKGDQKNRLIAKVNSPDTAKPET